MHADAPPRKAWSIPIIAAAGVLMSANLVVGRLTGIPWLCRPDSACGAVHASRYALFLGLPTAVWGVALYLVIAVCALGGLPARRWLLVFLLAVVGAATSTYLAWLAWTVLRARCVYCVVSATIALLLVIRVLGSRPRGAVRQGLWRPRALAVVAALTALATVAIVAAVHAAG